MRRAIGVAYAGGLSMLVLGSGLGVGCEAREGAEEAATGDGPSEEASDSRERHSKLRPSSGRTFSDVPYFGSVGSYDPRSHDRWAVANDGQDARYFLRTSDDEGEGGVLLGEYSIVRARTYADCIVKLSARSNEDLGSNPGASFAVIFGWKDPANYSYVALSGEAAGARLVTVRAGVGTVVAIAREAGIWDASYRTIEIWRHGGWIRALVDGKELLSTVGGTPEEDSALRTVGGIGVGSYGDSAYFDDIDVADYQALTTDRFSLSLPASGYADAVASLLENAYAINLEHTRQDVNARMGHEKYTFRYRPSGWRWWDDPQGFALGGGLSVTGGPSAVSAELLPESRNPASGRNLFVAISLHELGNGWGLPVGDILPQWVRSEAHSGFLRAEAELALGYCDDANAEHANHLGDYARASLDERRINGASVEPMLVSLVERYGWMMFRNLYATSVSGGFAYLASMSANDADNEVSLFLSRQAQVDLTTFFHSELGIVPNQQALEGVRGLPMADVSILPALPCRPPMLHVTPAALDIEVTTNRPRATAVVYVASPLPWTGQLAGGRRVTMSRTNTSNTTTISLQADLTGMPAGSKAVSWLLLRAASPNGAIVRVPVMAHVALPLAGPVANSSFESGRDGVPSSWSSSAYAPGDADVAFGWSDRQRHIGERSASIDNLAPNDAHWDQTVTGLTPGLKYVLVGWLKGKSVGGGQTAANINIFGTWDRAGLNGTFDWTKLTLPFLAPDSGSVTVACRLGFWGETVTGQLWCDDLQILPAAKSSDGL